ILLPVWLAVFLTAKSAPPKLTLKETDFTSLEGWQAAGHVQAFSAFIKSCEKLTPRPGYLIPDGFKNETFARAFSDACAKAIEGEDFYGGDADAARTFFEEAFVPYKMRNGWTRKGKITGYYEPLMEASLEPSPDYPYPLYRAPGDQIRVDLSKFRNDLTGTIVGRIEGNSFLPYYTRRDIDEGAFNGKGLEILYARDPIDVYFLQVQGSGRARLPDGRIIGVGYAGKNGHANTLAGRTLVQTGEMEIEEVSMQSIRQWFKDNPARIFEILHKDDSYVFFTLTGGDGPFGSSGAELTPEHSLAIDPTFAPMGLPIFIDGEIPTLDNPDEFEPLRQLLIAQDTGGAIKGAIRGDVFWGRGEKATYLAGYMNNEATFTLLLPRGALGDD
ncbi:MAG: murein transglycosylase A, partial [Sphingomonadales bacterium]